MFETLKNAFKVKDIRKKILITIGFILLYRLGCFIPVPGVNQAGFASTIGGNDFLGIMSAISGGALSQGTLFSMGIGPYINASIIIQLLTIGIPALERLSKQGEEGRKKISQITRYVTLALAIVQSIAILIAAGKGGIDTSIFGEKLAWLTYIFIVAIFVAGSALTMWIGERMTDYGVGNGITLLIFVGILATAGNALIAQAAAIFGGDMKALWALVAFLAAVIVIFAGIVTVDLAERKIPVQYAKQIKGRKMYGGQSTFIPIKVNSSGVLPLIFAFAITSLPSLIMGLFWPNTVNGFTIFWNTWLGTNGWLYPLILSVLIVFFAYFYAMIQFNPDDVAKNIQQYGGFVPGIRPGKPTGDHLRKISNRITLFGAIYLAFIALVPSVIFRIIGGANGIGLVNAFSTTGLLIVVSAALEFNQQLESQLMMRHYKGFLK
ncbi:MAG: preprotein translocase subunit SecY [Clostridia bacterium]